LALLVGSVGFEPTVNRSPPDLQSGVRPLEHAALYINYRC